MIKSLFYSAIVKSVSSRIVTYIIQFICLAIYARLFSPEEFGTVASIYVFVVFFQMLAEMGIGPAIINEEKFDRRQRDGIFTLTLIVSVLLSFAFFLFSYFLNYLYAVYQYQNLAIIITISIFFYTLNIIPTTAMLKDTRFIELAIIDVLAECLALLVVYSLYKSEFGLLALVVRPAVVSSFKFICTWFISDKTSIGRANFGSELYHINEILSFSSYQFGFNFINYFSRNLDNIIVAKYFGMYSVGIYDKAYQLMRYPLMLTTYAIVPAIQPVLSKVNNDIGKVIEIHNQLTKRLFSISLPISFFIFLNSESIILCLFGEQWIPVDPLIKIFSFIIPIQAVLSTSGAFFQVVNKPRIMFLSGILSTLVNMSAILIGAILGKIEYIAFALVIGFFMNFIQTYYLLFKYCFFIKPKVFYINILQAVLVMSMPIIIYYFLTAHLFVNLILQIGIQLLLEMILGIFSLMIWYRPILYFLK